MEMERRACSRKQYCSALSIIFDDREVHANLKSISAGGALLCVVKEDGDRISPTDVERSVTCRMRRGKSHVNCSGTIGRYIESEHHKYLTVLLNGRAAVEFTEDLLIQI